MKPPKNFFAPMGLVGCIFYLLAIASLFPSPALNATVPTIPKEVALTICSLGILSSLAWFAYVKSTSTATVQTYFSRMGIALVIMAVSMLLWYVDTIIAQLGNVGGAQLEKLVALNCVLMVAICYQFARGVMSMRSQWKTSQDVIEFVRRSHLVSLEDAKKHDYAFYGGVIIIFNIIARTFNADVLLLHICVVGLALIIPYVCGAHMSRYLIVRRILPNDAPLPAELQM